MTTKKYNQYLTLASINYEERLTSFFEYGVGMSSVLTTWHQLGLKTNAYDKDNAYIIDMLDENGNVVGNFKSVPGGIYWEYPELIMQLKKYEEERGLI
jgi:hypothetical protein